MTRFNGEQILLVEDNARLLRSMAFLLTIAGFDVLSAADGTAALDLLQSHTPHLIISDIDMPDTDGYQLLRHVRATPTLAAMPVILTSDRYGLDDLMFALDLGADDYLPKPFDFHEVMEVITRTLVGEPRHRHPLAG
jgi:DNA-binding response OmpR family regulator